VSPPIFAAKYKNIFIYENSHVYGPAIFLIRTANFIMKQNSGAAQGLTVVTGNHLPRIGVLFLNNINDTNDIEKDVVVEEDVWIGANVTLLSGVVIGRGSIIGAGAVCRKSVPPYAVVLGNPAKVVGFKFRPEEIIEHEKKLYSESERLLIEVLQKNYERFFYTKIDKIKDFLN
jgi:acetyltransferase-like isoleucine patch superfamily enzyme